MPFYPKFDVDSALKKEHDLEISYSKIMDR